MLVPVRENWNSLLWEAIEIEVAENVMKRDCGVQLIGRETLEAGLSVVIEITYPSNSSVRWQLKYYDPIHKQQLIKT